MRTTIYSFGLLVFTIFVLIGCSHKEENNKEDVLIDFGEGTYRPTPFFLDNIIPFSWMGRPDSVKKETEVIISFNEDAIRSKSKANLFLADSKGNRIKGVQISNGIDEDFLINAKKENATIPIRITVDPMIGDSLLTGSIMVVGDKLDEVNDTALMASATPVGYWQLTHKTGINWWRWFMLILIVALAIVIICIACYGIGKVWMGISTHIPSLRKPRFTRKKTRKNKTKDNGMVHGRYLDDKTYVLDKYYIIPNGSQYKNPSGKTNGELMEELKDKKGVIKLKNGEPIFNKDGGTRSGKPLEIDFPEGIDQYLNKENLRSGKKVDRQYLHNKAFERIAEKYGMSPDELQVFKGNSEPIERLKKQWNCSEQQVYKRCRNPHRINRVLHECRNGKTVQLVPWLYHHMSHSGGIEAMRGK